MTFNEAYEFLDDLCDKAGTAYFTSVEKKRFLKLGTYNYLEGRAKSYESDKVSLDGLYTLLKTEQPVSTVPTDFLHSMSIYDGTPQNEIVRVKLNNWSSYNDDLDSRPGLGQNKPACVLMGNQFVFAGSPTTPTLIYMKQPTFATDDATGEFVDLPEQEQFKIIEYTFKEQMGSMSDPRYNIAQEKIRDKRE